MWVCVIRMLFAFGSSLLFGLPVIFHQTAQQSDQLLVRHIVMRLTTRNILSTPFIYYTVT